MEQKIKDLFATLSEEESLSLIRKEVKKTSKEVTVKRKGVNVKETRRGRSQTVMDGIHGILDSKHTLDCRNAEFPCLLELVEEYMPERVGKQVIDALAVIIPALYPKVNTQASHLSDFSKVIAEKFPDLKTYAKAKLHISKEASLQRRANYTALVAARNKNQELLSDTRVLEVISELRKATDYISQICLVGLCSGSRLVEILLVSTYEQGENPHWLKVIGVAKDPNDPQTDAKDDEAEDNKREVIKPVIGFLDADDIRQLVTSIRQKLEEQYNYDLGQNIGKRKVTRRKITSLLDARCNKRVKMLFGQRFVFHSLRGLYASMAWAQFNPQGISLTAYTSKILGHLESSMATALSYQTIAVQQSLRQDDPQLTAKINNLQAEFDGWKESFEGEKKTVRPPLPEMVKAASGGTAGTPKEIQFYKKKPGEKAKELVLSIKKEPRKKDGPMEKLLRVKQAAEKLQQNGAPLSYANLQKLGFGKRIVGDFFRLKKAEAQKEQGPAPMLVV